MATVSDKLVGLGMMLVAILVVSYYTIWTIVLPFIDETHVLHMFFLPWWWAVMLPSIALLILIVFIGLFVGIIVMQDSSRNYTKSHHD